MTYNTDGNLAALRQYEREQDAINMAEDMFEQELQNFVDSMTEAYVDGNQAVVEEINTRLVESENWTNYVHKALKAEFLKPVKMRGSHSYEALLEMVEDACKEIASGCDTVEELEHRSIDYGL